MRNTLGSGDDQSTDQKSDQNISDSLFKEKEIKQTNMVERFGSSLTLEKSRICSTIKDLKMRLQESRDLIDFHDLEYG